MITSRDTQWGQVCVAIHAAMLAHLPGLGCNIGPDEGAATGAPPLISFDHAGGETIERQLRGGAGAGSRGPWDRLPSIGFEAWGRTPVESEAIFSELLFALDEVAHGRAGKPGSVKPEVGSLTAGQLGTKYAGTFVVRVPVRRASRGAVAVDIGVTVAASAPDGSEGDAAEIV